jgi:hypothetical protein
VSMDELEMDSSVVEARQVAAERPMELHIKLPSPEQGVAGELVREGTPEFDERCNVELRRVAEKYAWTAQQEGIVLRRNPLKQAPYRDYVFNRIAKVEYGFFYLDGSGRKRFWYPSFEDILGATIDDEEDFGFIVTERIEFLPGKDEVTHDSDGCRVLNLWRPPAWRSTEGGPEPAAFIGHLDYLFDGDKKAVEHVLDFLAHMVQRPWERVSHALLITSEAKGIGKSTLGAIIRRLVGEQNSRVAQTKDLKSAFDGWLVGKLVVQVDEVYEAGNWDLANKLKPLITEPTVSVNVKYGPQMEVENYARFIMFSNHTAPLSIEEGDRRYFIVNSKAQPRDDGYYEELYRVIGSEEGMESLYSYLMNRDLSGFNPYRRPPMTDAKEAMIEVSGNPLRTYISDSVDSGHFRQELNREFTLDALQRLLQKDGYGAHAKNLKELSEALKSAGIEQVRKTDGSRKRRLWRLPDFVDVPDKQDDLHDF